MVNNFPTHYYLGKELEDLEKLENCLRGALMKIFDYHDQEVCQSIGSSRSLSDEIRADASGCADSGGNGTERYEYIASNHIELRKNAGLVMPEPECRAFVLSDQEIEERNRRQQVQQPVQHRVVQPPIQAPVRSVSPPPVQSAVLQMVQSHVMNMMMTIRKWKVKRLLMG